MFSFLLCFLGIHVCACTFFHKFTCFSCDFMIEEGNGRVGFQMYLLAMTFYEINICTFVLAFVYLLLHYYNNYACEVIAMRIWPIERAKGLSTTVVKKKIVKIPCKFLMKRLASGKIVFSKKKLGELSDFLLGQLHCTTPKSF